MTTTTKSSGAGVVPEQSQALTKWDEELAKQAAQAAEQYASIGGGQFFSLRGGMLKLNGAQLPDNQMAVIVLDSLLENVFYPDAFDPDDPQNPNCYAFGRDAKAMAPHAQAEAPQAKLCAECPHNQWGSLVVNGQQRRGKACRNRSRLALIPGGTLEAGTGRFTPYAGADDVNQAPLAYLALPPTSVAGFANYVKQLAGALAKPPSAVFTKVKLEPDSKTTFRVVFTALGPVPEALLGAVMERSREVASVIDFPYQAGARPAEAAGGGRKEKGGGKTPEKRRKY